MDRTLQLAWIDSRWAGLWTYVVVAWRGSTAARLWALPSAVAAVILIMGLWLLLAGRLFPGSWASVLTGVPADFLILTTAISAGLLGLLGALLGLLFLLAKAAARRSRQRDQG